MTTKFFDLPMHLIMHADNVTDFPKPILSPDSYFNWWCHLEPTTEKIASTVKDILDFHRHFPDMYPEIKQLAYLTIETIDQLVWVRDSPFNTAGFVHDFAIVKTETEYLFRGKWVRWDDILIPEFQRTIPEGVLRSQSLHWIRNN